MPDFAPGEEDDSPLVFGLDEPCTESDGNERVGLSTAHDVFIVETGQCPWCGMTETGKREVSK